MVIGDVGFVGPPGEDGVVEIGFSVIPSYRGRGIATEAVRALSRWGLSQPTVLSILARCEPGNGPPSMFSRTSDSFPTASAMVGYGGA
jgi:RimJ/RimL family protein N-acetyltransferase